MKELPLVHIYIEETNEYVPVFKGENETYICKIALPENDTGANKTYTLRIYQDRLPSDISSTISIEP